MSGAVLGAIEVQMLMDVARWKDSVDESARHLDKGLERMRSTATSAVAGLAAGLSAGAFGNWIKGAIDAADEAGKMAQKMGVATEDVAGLQLAMKLSGVEGETLQKAFVKLSKGVAEGDEVYKRMGISVRNTDGSLKGAKQVFYEVADVISKLPPGVNKTALAIDVFGEKLGSNLMPGLNGGAAGLREITERAERMGLVISEDTAKAAEKFNDELELLKLGTKGTALTMAGELLPTLNAFVAALADSGDGAKKAKKETGFWTEVLAKSVEVVTVLGLEARFMFKAITGEVATMFKQLKAYATGNFAEGLAIGKAWTEQAADMRTELDLQTSAILTARRNEALAADGAAQNEPKYKRLLDVRKGLNGAEIESAAASKAAADAAAKAAAEHQKLLSSYQKTAVEIRKKLDLQDLEEQSGRKLSEAEREYIKLMMEVRDGKITVAELTRNGTLAIAQENVARAQASERQKDENKALEDKIKLMGAVAQHSSRMVDEQIKTTESLRTGNVQLIEQNEKLRIGDEAWAKRERAVLLNQAADLEWQAANEGGNYQLEEQARLLRDRAQLLADGTALKEAKAVADEWTKTTQSIQDGLTDAIMRGFENGKGFLDNFKDVLLNAFKTLILKPMAQSMVGQIGGGLQAAMGYLGGLMGTSGTTGTAGGTGAAGGAVAAGGAAAGAVPWIGWAVAGAMKANADYKEGFGSRQAISAQNSIFGNNFGQWSTEGALANLFSSIGLNDKWASLLSGSTAVAKLIGRKDPKITEQGVTGSFGGGKFEGSLFADWKAEGGIFRSDKSGTNFAAMDAELKDLLASGADALLTGAKEYASALGLPVTSLGSVTKGARILLGQDAEANKKAISEALASYGNELVKGFEGVLAAAAESGETTADTLNRLGEAIGLVNSTFETLGLHLVQTSVAGGQAADELVKLTGGMDAFLAKTQAYLQGYFTQGEQLGLGASSVLKTLKDAGIDFGGATQRQDLRALMEGIDPNNATGRTQMAALLTVAGDFAKLTDYLAEQNITLGQLAQQAPTKGVPVGEDPASRSANAAEASAAALLVSNERLAELVDSNTATVGWLQAVVATLQAAAQQSAEQIASLATALEDAARMNDIAPGPVGGGGL